MTQRVIHVVAGVLIDAGRVCVARRRDGSHQGGKWEFPGGKLELNEGPLAGLKRELHEELGIEVQQASPFVSVRYDYGDKEILLDVWHVTQYRGTPHGREAQPLRWVLLPDLNPDEFPDADRPVLRRLQLPILYLLSDVGRVGRSAFIDRLTRVLRAGARLIQLREPQLDRKEFVALAQQVAELCHRHGARLLVNADPDWTADCHADGVHLNSHRLMALQERPLTPDDWVAASCHNERELRKAQQMGLDFAVLGPVQATASHPGVTAIGWEHFRTLCRAVTVPVYAIGGMQPEHASVAVQAGARGLAMIRGVWDRGDLENAVQSLTRFPWPVASREVERV